MGFGPWKRIFPLKVVVFPADFETDWFSYSKDKVNRCFKLPSY
jgi:hypothetical protein